MPVATRGGVGEGEEMCRLIKEAEGGVEWKGDKLGVVRAPVARVSLIFIFSRLLWARMDDRKTGTKTDG